jgi:hypothetical protein
MYLADSVSLKNTEEKKNYFKTNRTWDPAVNITGCSSRGPRFNSQHPHGSSQLTVTPALEDLTPSHIHVVKSPKHKKFKNKNKNKT